MSSDLLEESAGRLSLRGPVKMDTAASVVAAARPFVEAGDCVLDWQEVPAVDSAALSVVLSLLRTARAAGHRLVNINVPDAFKSLAELYDVDGMIAGHTDTPLSPAPSATHA